VDVGCGTGYTTAGILKRTNVCEVVGVDLNPVQLSKAARNLQAEKPKTYKVFYTPLSGEVEGLFRGAELKEVKSELTGVRTVFGTDKYVVVAWGTK